MKQVIVTNSFITTREATREVTDLSKFVIREQDTLGVCAYRDYSLAVDARKNEYILFDNRNFIKRRFKYDSLQELFDTLLNSYNPKYKIFIKEDDE